MVGMVAQLINPIQDIFHGRSPRIVSSWLAGLTTFNNPVTNQKSVRYEKVGYERTLKPDLVLRQQERAQLMLEACIKIRIRQSTFFSLTRSVMRVSKPSALRRRYPQLFTSGSLPRRNPAEACCIPPIEGISGVVGFCPRDDTSL